MVAAAIRHVAGVEGDLRTSHVRHESIRPLLEGDDTDVRIGTAPVAGHRETKVQRGRARQSGGQDRHLVAASVERGRRGQHRREVAARSPGHRQHAHNHSESDRHHSRDARERIDIE
jgi:hypothetical protein